MSQGNRTEPKAVERATRLQRFKEKCKEALKFSFIFVTGLHIVKIVIASIYFNECPVEPNIPKFLLILGILGVATKLVTLFRNFLIKYVNVAPILSLIGIAELAIFITASYYTYREYKPSYNPLDIFRYCNKTLYLFSFIYLTIFYCLLVLIVLCVGCSIISIILLDKTAPNTADEAVESSTAEALMSSKQESKQTDSTQQ